MCRSACFVGVPLSSFYVVFEENGFIHIFAVILDGIMVHITFGNSLDLETFVGLGMLTYMEKKQEPEFNCIQ